MASFLPTLASCFIITFSLLSSFPTSLVLGEVQNQNNYARTTYLKNPMELHKKQKLTQFRFYFHDTSSGSNPTAIRIVPAPSKFSQTLFGSVSMMDDPLTIGPELSSELVGRAQGLYGVASQDDFGLLMAANFAFTEGMYNGSTITVLGRNQVMSEVREMPVIGGTGMFRFAKGYVEARTYKFDVKTGDATVECNVYVLHY